jgi:hypothetical protein
MYIGLHVYYPLFFLDCNGTWIFSTDFPKNVQISNLIKISSVGAELFHAEERADGHDECVISGFHRDVDDTCALLGYYAAMSGSCVPTFQDNLSVPSSRAKKTFFFWTSWLFKIGQIGCPKTSVHNYHSCCLTSQKRAYLRHDETNSHFSLFCERTYKRFRYNFTAAEPQSSVANSEYELPDIITIPVGSLVTRLTVM